MSFMRLQPNKQAESFLLPEHVINLASLGVVPIGGATIAVHKGMTPQNLRTWSLEVGVWRGIRPVPFRGWPMPSGAAPITGADRQIQSTVIIKRLSLRGDRPTTGQTRT